MQRDDFWQYALLFASPHAYGAYIIASRERTPDVLSESRMRDPHIGFDAGAAFHIGR
jgi:hypothetical protein